MASSGRFLSLYRTFDLFSSGFFDLFSMTFSGTALTGFNYRFFDLFDNLTNSFDDFIGNCLDRRYNYRFFCFSLCFSSCFNTLTKNFSFFDLQSGLAGPSPTSPVSKSGSKAFADNSPAAASASKVSIASSFRLRVGEPWSLNEIFGDDLLNDLCDDDLN